MNIVNKLTLRHLKENKGRTVVTTLGICVSVAMITAVFVAVLSFTNLFGELTYLAGGHYEASMDVGKAQLQSIEKDERVARVGVMLRPEADSFSLDADKPSRGTTGDFLTGDKVCLEQMITGDYEGKIPENENEIAVEQEFISKNHLDWKVGDTVKIPVGIRYFDEENGGADILYGTYTNGERFGTESVNDYKITAILHTNPATIANYYILRGYDLTANPLGEDEYVTALVQLKNVNYKSLDDIKDIIKSNNVESYIINDDYLEMHFAIDEDSVIVTSLLPMAAIILAIIIIASVVLIYNAFAMSISERVRYLGMLASVGATKKQKMLSVFYEGMILGLFGIPLGIGAGIAGIGITLNILGEKIISTGMINGVSSDNMKMKIVVSPYAIIGIIIVSIFTIFISSFIPAIKASRITPIDAIRQSKEVKLKAKKLKSSRLIRKIFGYEGELANKNLKRNGRKARIITASIALSVILFLSCNYFCDMLTQEFMAEMEIPYQVYASVDYDKKDEFIKEVENINGVDRYYCVNSSYNVTPKSNEKEYGWRLIDDKYLTPTYKRLFKSSNNLFINAIDDKDFNSLCKANGIDYRDYYGENRKALLMNNISHRTGGAAVFNESVVGVSLEDFSYRGLTVGALIDYDADNYVCNLNQKNSISLYVPVSQHKAMVDEQNAQYADKDELSGPIYYTYMLGIETRQHEEVAEKISELYDTTDYGSTYYIDVYESMQTMNTIALVVEVLVYGFIALISLITVFNIINTISTGIALRRKEFAMLKSVGTTPKGFNKMIVLESAFYGLKALVFALPISALLSLAMNKAMGVDSVPFELNVPLYLAVIAVVFVVISMTMLYSVHKLKNDSIVETLKEDIS